MDARTIKLIINVRAHRSTTNKVYLIRNIYVYFI